MNEQKFEEKKLCPITDGTCKKDCGYDGHITINLAKKNKINVFSLPVDPADANICDGCE